MNSLSLLLALIVVAACSAFAPMPNAPRMSTAVYGLDNMYARGGKPSWEFEQDTMYVEEPKAKAAPKKKVVAKKTVVKAAAPKKAAAPTKALNPFAKLFN